MLAVITGETFFGVRHGLETLAQLIVYDDIQNVLVMPNYVNISDRPYYPYRGLMLDTSRNYFSVESIKRTINTMAANKLNTFHWHITDSQSFPLMLNDFPQFAEYGAYSREKVIILLICITMYVIKLKIVNLINIKYRLLFTTEH